MPKKHLSAISLIFLLILLAVYPAFVNSAQDSEFDCRMVSEIPRRECRALLSIYNSTNGSTWINQTNWLSSATPCSWYGLSCESGHITRIDLSYNNLTGTIPNDIRHLSQLSQLRMGVNQLRGPIPDALGHLRQLTFLELGHNQFNSPLPASIGRLPRIEFMSFFFSGLTGTIPANIGRLTTLHYLNLGRNHLEGQIPESITALVNLITLDIGLNCLTSPNQTVTDFLNIKDPDWGSDQTSNCSG